MLYRNQVTQFFMILGFSVVISKGEDALLFTNSMLAPNHYLSLFIGSEEL